MALVPEVRVPVGVGTGDPPLHAARTPARPSPTPPAIRPLRVVELLNGSVTVLVYAWGELIRSAPTQTCTESPAPAVGLLLNALPEAARRDSGSALWGRAAAAMSRLIEEDSTSLICGSQPLQPVRERRGGLERRGGCD